jgi:type II secretory pathway component HofQ
VRSRRHTVRVLLPVAVLVACGAPTWSPAESLEAIPLHHRLAEEIIPLLQPLLPGDAAVTGTGNVLLVRADAATLQQVRAALAVLDRAPRQLTITVGQATGSSDRNRSVRGSGTIASDDVHVGVNRPPAAESGAEIVVRGDTSRDDLRNVSTVRALEGREAYVAIGQSQPFTSSSVITSSPHGTVHSHSTGYRDVLGGFYVTPRLQGERVTLEISPFQQQPANVARNPSVATQTLTTTVSGRLGEWIELGGAAGASDGSTAGLVTWGARSELTQYSAWVKVQEIP